MGVMGRLRDYLRHAFGLDDAVYSGDMHLVVDNDRGEWAEYRIGPDGKMDVVAVGRGDVPRRWR